MGRKAEAICKNRLLHRNFKSLSVNSVKEKIVYLQPSVTYGVSKKTLQNDTLQNGVGSPAIGAYVCVPVVLVCALFFARYQGQTKIHVKFAQRPNMWPTVSS